MHLAGSTSNLQRQLIYPIVQGQTELVLLFSIRPPVKRSTDTGAEQPEFDVIQFVDH